MIELGGLRDSLRGMETGPADKQMNLGSTEGMSVHLAADERGDFQVRASLTTVTWR
jgi:hypothetical protein